MHILSSTPNLPNQNILGVFSPVSQSCLTLCDLMDYRPWPPCPSPTPGACSYSCLLSWWCHQTISSSVVHFSSCVQSFPASGSFPVSQFFALGGQSIGASASASVLPVNIQCWFPLRLTGLISLQSKRFPRFFSNTTVQKHQFFGAQLSLWSNSYNHTCMYACMLSRFSRVRLCVTLWTAAHQAPLSTGFSRQEYWSGLPFPSPMHACMLSPFSRVWLCATPWTAAHQGSSVHGIL